MKNLIKLLGIIALVAVIGFSMVGCVGDDDKCSDCGELLSSPVNTNHCKSGCGFQTGNCNCE